MTVSASRYEQLEDRTKIEFALPSWSWSYTDHRGRVFLDFWLLSVPLLLSPLMLSQDCLADGMGENVDNSFWRGDFPHFLWAFGDLPSPLVTTLPLNPNQRDSLDLPLYTHPDDHFQVWAELSPGERKKNNKPTASLMVLQILVFFPIFMVLLTF